jgi:hypothetical protein
MKSKRTKKRAKQIKRAKSVKRTAKLLIKLRNWTRFIDEAYQLEAKLARKPKVLEIEFVGAGEIPADTALLMRSVILSRPGPTRVVTNARSSLVGATVLVWLTGDTRRIREDSSLIFAPGGEFTPDDRPVRWEDPCTCESCEMEAHNHIRVLQAINEFLPAKELAGRPVDYAVLKQFGLVDTDEVDEFLAEAFRGDKSRSEKNGAGRRRELVKEASR